MKKYIFIAICVFLLLMFYPVRIEGQPIPIIPYITQYIRTLLDDADAATARDTLELGTDDEPNFASVNLSGDHINIATDKTPTGPSDTGTKGDMAWNSDYIFVAVDTDTWKRVAIATWSDATDYLLLETGDYILLETGDKLYLEP